MSLLRTLARRHAWLTALLLVLATGARAAVPQGWMPEAQAGGSVHLIPCEGVAVAPAMPGMHHQHAMHGGEDGHGARHADQPCAFAGMIGPLLPHGVLAEVPGGSVTGKDFAPSGTVAPAISRPIPRPPSRGPPRLS